MKELAIKGETLSERSRKNLSILDTIRRVGPISKTDISGLIGVNVVTVSNYVEEFLRQKLIFEKELDVSKGGRRPVLLDLNSDCGYAIGIGFNLLNTIAVLVDMRGKLILRVKNERTQNRAADIVESILKLTRDLLAQAKDYKDKIKGVGIAIAGIVDDKRETVRWPEIMDKKNHTYSLITLPLKDIVEKEFNYPVIVDNDATMACFGEQWLSQDVEIQNLLYMFSGVGCGIMINGEIYRGANGCAGEISIYNPREQQSFSCEAGQPCFLKRWELDIGMLDAARKELPSNKSSKIWELCGGSLDKLNLRNIFEAVKSDDHLALDIVKGAARRLGIKVAFLVNLLNPQVVIIGGGLEEAGMPFIEEIKRSVGEWAFEESSSAVRIIPSRLGENAIALGAANFIVREVFAGVKE
ncbi:MAG: ROK family protein [Candidatus Omnitrophica bacterium]|nr:ROK family protein [Candidatus Omnitrophota bacterium]MDD5352984.1 ROK family protein [Candidatus Omnitrophota bacterium]MDD5550583.1 ROK family protein [Candidatus Omnitrophota bacterium]